MRALKFFYDKSELVQAGLKSQKESYKKWGIPKGTELFPGIDATVSDSLKWLESIYGWKVEEGKKEVSVVVPISNDSSGRYYSWSQIPYGRVKPNSGVKLLQHYSAKTGMCRSKIRESILNRILVPRIETGVFYSTAALSQKGTSK